MQCSAAASNVLPFVHSVWRARKTVAKTRRRGQKRGQALGFAGCLFAAVGCGLVSLVDVVAGAPGARALQTRTSQVHAHGETLREDRAGLSPSSHRPPPAVISLSSATALPPTPSAAPLNYYCITALLLPLLHFSLYSLSLSACTLPSRPQSITVPAAAALTKCLAASSSRVALSPSSPSSLATKPLPLISQQAPPALRHENPHQLLCCHPVLGATLDRTTSPAIQECAFSQPLPTTDSQAKARRATHHHQHLLNRSPPYSR